MISTDGLRPRAQRGLDLLDKKERTGEEDHRMLGFAHESRHHWQAVGTPTNRAVGDWQRSRIYFELSHPKLALEVARECAAACDRYWLPDIRRTADEGMARAYAAARRIRDAIISLERARKRLAGLGSEDGEKTYLRPDRRYRVDDPKQEALTTAVRARF